MPDGKSGNSALPALSMDLRGTSTPVLVQVRRWAARALAEVDDVHLDDVLLVVTELVTNAYDHGEGPLEVRMQYSPAPCRVRIEVDDSCLAHPVVAAPSQTAPGGRGMLLVAKLTAGWGVRERPGTGGKTVWAEVSCDALDTDPGAGDTS